MGGKVITFFPVVTYSFSDNQENTTQVLISEVCSVFTIDRIFQGLFVLGLLSRFMCSALTLLFFLYLLIHSFPSMAFSLKSYSVKGIVA